ncbi:hypothetical protein PoB_006837300 [Plakobranchus ocellatus]|uniref:Uncharacterized protein n=1 Tax=Plakobranchus ocellatus TaxID=259542 RepID=A0AAV4DCB9_9GAST|nr:hypothetical protein PoB_006837300 [Plakobranchus ocellatus]
MKAQYKKKWKDEQSVTSHQIDSESKSHQLQLKSFRNKYSDQVRLTYMALQGEANVAAENTTKVVQIVARYLFNKEISGANLPAPSALNFMNEAHILAKQATESLLSSQHFTFATDGTSRQEQHYLEKHVHLDNGKFMFLGYSEIAADGDQTLLETSVAAFKNLSTIY